MESIKSGLTAVAYDIGQMISGGVDAVENVADGLGDAAEIGYHSAAAGADALVGDMAGAEQHHAAATEDLERMDAHFHEAGQAITDDNWPEEHQDQCSSPDDGYEPEE